MIFGVADVDETGVGLTTVSEAGVIAVCGGARDVVCVGLYCVSST